MILLTFVRISPWKLDRFGRNLADGQGSGKSDPVVNFRRNRYSRRVNFGGGFVRNITFAARCSSA